MLTITYNPWIVFGVCVAVGLYMFVKEIELPKVNLDTLFFVILALVLYENVSVKRG